MAKLNGKHGQSVSLLDDLRESNPAKKNANNTRITLKEANSSKVYARLEKLIILPPKSEAALLVALIYEDAQTREWAREAYERVAKLAGEKGIRPTWWKLDNLGAPGVLAAAVSTAMRADVIVLAARAGEGMPLSFYTWINAWLPNRFEAGGVLAAFLGHTGSSDARPARVGEYLRETARRGRMSFLLETRKLGREANGSNGFAHPGSATDGAFIRSPALESLRF